MVNVREPTNGIQYKVFSRREHPRAHIHLLYAEHSASVALDTLDVLAGRLPGKQLAEAMVWLKGNRDELLAMWPKRELPGGIYKIKD